MNILKYLAFIKTVEYGSFTKASEALNYSQSAISRMIGDLEKEWGVVLLERCKGGVVLTGDGYSMLPHAKAVCAEYDRLTQKADELNGLRSGIIRIGTFSSVATHILPHVIKEFQKDYPGIDYELLLSDYTEIEGWLADGRVDLAFLILPTRPEFETIFMMDDYLKVVLPESHPLAAYDRVPIEKICDYPFMLLEKGGRSEVKDFLDSRGISPKVHFTTLDDYVITSMVESGLGISILPELILKRMPYRVVAKDLDVPAFRKIAVALRSTRTSSLAAKKFLEYLLPDGKKTDKIKR